MKVSGLARHTMSSRESVYTTLVDNRCMVMFRERNCIGKEECVGMMIDFVGLQYLF